MAKSIPQELQAVDILVNNAGLALGLNPAATTTLVRGMFEATTYFCRNTLIL
jgi:NADP-dependent 3-hydroxy acid dehydrogenase YdfG